MKKPIILLGGAVVAIAAFAASEALADPAYATRYVNIRSGPGLTYEVVDQLVTDEPVDRGNCNADASWCYVRHEGTNGWVAAIFLTTTSPNQQETPSGNVAPTVSSDQYKAKATVNIRTGPGLTYLVVDRLDTGEIVKRMQCSSDGTWCYVSHDGADGWVSAEYLTPVRPTPPVIPPSTSKRIVTAAVNVRSGPDISYNVVSQLNVGESVELGQCDATGTWCYITHDGPDGWVAARFLGVPPQSGPEPPPGPGPGPLPPQTVTQKTGTAITGMPVRSAPTLFTSTVGHLDQGDTIPVKECSADGYWCHVVNDTINGWVPAAFLRITEVEVPVTPRNIAIVASDAPFRGSPNNKAKVLGLFESGLEVKVIQCDSDGKWCQISHGSVTGWVKANTLRAPDNPMPSPYNQPQSGNSFCFTGADGVQICLNT